MWDSNERTDALVALSALETFSLELDNIGVPEHHKRSIILLAWGTAREGKVPEDGAIDASLSGEEAAIAEVGAIIVAAALEAKRGEHHEADAGGRMKAGSWQWVCWRVEACARAAACAGAAPERCATVQRLGLALLEPYREQLGGPPANIDPVLAPSMPSSARAPAPQLQPLQNLAKDPMATLWVSPREGAAWHGPITAREVLRLAEAGQLLHDALICGLSEPVGSAPTKKKSQPLWQSFPALGAAARKDSEAIAQFEQDQAVEAGGSDSSPTDFV